MRLRSLLYVPASAERFIAKAHMRGADAIILDLEDGVAPAHKDGARARLSASIAQVGQAGARVFVRINGDLATAVKDAEAAYLGAAFGLFVAKSDAQKITELDRFLTTIEATATGEPMALVAMVEDPGAVLDAREIARRPRLLALCVGGEDLATSLGARPDPDVFRLPKQLVHYAAKAEGLMSFGMFRTVADYSDLVAIKVAALEARRFGFDGASCVHPSSVPILNAAFAPSAEDVAWARRVIAASAANDAGALSLDGQMIDAPVVARARAILAAL